MIKHKPVVRPCPFCGGKPVLERGTIGGGWVRCPCCGTEQDFSQTIKGAIKKWNQRARTHNRLM